MKSIALLALASVCLCLGGCALNASNIGAATTFVQALSGAGCQGTLDVSANATTAAMGVPSASLSNSFHGSCTPPPAKASTPATTASAAP